MSASATLSRGGELVSESANRKGDPHRRLVDASGVTSVRACSIFLRIVESKSGRRVGEQGRGAGHRPRVSPSENWQCIASTTRFMFAPLNCN